MKCPNCEEGKAEVFMADPVECAHCSETTYIEYYRCNTCSCVFKAIGEEMVEDSLMSMSEGFMSTLDEILTSLFGMAHDVVSEEEFKQILEENVDVIDVKEIRLSQTDNMTDLVHRCLNCNSIAYEISDGDYECPKCGFSWEVVSCG